MTSMSPASERPHVPVAASPRGFTIVELLVTIAVIAALMGILLVGLQAARRAGATTKEKSNLGQLYKAWTMYASQNNDSAMPGYLDEGVQTAWGLSWKGSDRKTKIPAEYCTTYPHRLASYLDYSPDVLYDYMNAEDDAVFKAEIDDGTGPVLNTAGLQMMSLHPAFGYNAYYVGGWWRTVAGVPTLRFGNATWNDSEGLTHTGGVVALKSTNIARPSEMIVFCASALREPGFYKADSEFSNGAAWVVPHLLGGEELWRPWDGSSFGSMGASAPGDSAGSIFTAMANGTATATPSYTLAQSGATGLGMEVLGSGANGVPFKRFGIQVTHANADGSVSGAGIGELQSQHRWMNPAAPGPTSGSFTHSNND